MQLLQAILLLGFFTIIGAGNRFRDTYLDKFCKEQIGDAYQAQEAPTNMEEPGKPLKVFVKFKVIDIDEIDGAHMDYRLHMYFKLFWKDSRLNRTDNLTNDCSAYVWTPDVMFETAKSIQTYDNVPTGFWIEPSGLVIMTDRYSFKANCIMNFRDYPFDTQECVFSVVFMATGDNIAVLKWMDDKSSPYPGPAIKFSRTIEPLQYRLQDPKTYFTTLQSTYANFTYLKANFTLTRRLTGIILTMYIPTSLVVAVSWVTFWLRPDASPARVSLSITSLLTLCTQVQQYKSQLPAVNYITAMDIWLFVCIFGVFSTLLEFALCYNAFMRDRDEENKMKVKENHKPKSLASIQETKMDNAWADEKGETSTARSRRKIGVLSSERKIYFYSIVHADSLEMDIFCRKFFPTCFLVFVIIYWAYFLIASSFE